MKKGFILVFSLMLFLPVFASQDEILTKENQIQTRINNVGAKILNANKFEKRVTFVYDEEGKKSLVKADKTITKRQVVVFGEAYKNISSGFSRSS